MKLLILGDTQIDASPSLDHLDERGQSIRFQENIEAIRGILDIGIAENCELLVHLGDLTEKSNPSSLESDAAASLFQHWIKPKVRKALGVIGNHDGKIFDISSSSFAPLEKMSDGQLVAPHEPAVTTIPLDGVYLVTLPYLHGKTPEQVGEAHAKILEHVPKGAKAYLFMHYGVTGVMVGPKNLVLPGDNLSPAQLFPERYQAIFAGHIHKQQLCVTMDGKRDVPVIFPGSPVINDFGERNDFKGYAILDTKTGKWELRQVTPKRAWVQAEWPIDWPPIGAAPWKEGDIVKIAGEHPRGVDARAEMESLYKKGLPRPFATSWAVVPERAERVDRGEDVAKANSLLDASQELGKKLFPDNPNLKEALALVADKLREGRKAPLGANILFMDLAVVDFMTFAKLNLILSKGEPTLVGGPNGLGKTNFLEALLLLLSGKTSKGLNIGDLVRQGQKKAYLAGTLAADESTLFIERTITKNAKTGAGTQKLTVTVKPHGGTQYILDGTIADVQRSLDELLGSSYLSLKACNFMFQKDPSPFTKAEPGDRKKILADVLCLEPVLRAFKVLNDERLVKQRSFHDAEQAIKNAESFKPELARAELEKALSVASTELQKVQGEAQAAEKAWTGAQAAENAALEGVKSATAALQGLPDPGRTLAGAKQGLVATEEAYTASKERQKGTWRGLKDKLKAFELQAPVELDVMREARQAGEAKVRELEKALADARALVGTAQAANAVAAAEVNQAQKLVTRFSGVSVGECSLCGQPVTAEHLKMELKSAEEKLRAVKAQLAATDSDYTVRTADEKKASDLLLAAQAELKTVVAQITVAENSEVMKANVVAQILEIEGQVGKDKESHTAKVVELSSRIAELEQQVAAAEVNKAAAQDWLKLAQEKLDNAVIIRTQAGHVKDEATRWQVVAEAAKTKVEGHLADLEKWESVMALNSKQAEKAKLESETSDIACAIVDPKGGLPVYLVDSRIPYLEEKANLYMERLGMADLRISLSTVEEDKETLAVLVDNGFEPRLDIRAFSGGQLDRVEVAIKMALADLAADTRGSKLGLLCYDEPTGGLDEAGKEALAGILFDKAANGYPATYIVSHDPRLSEAFTRRLTVSKAADGSTTVA